MRYVCALWLVRLLHEGSNNNQCFTWICLFTDDPVLKSNNENRPDNFSAYDTASCDDLKSIVSSKDDDANGQESYDQSKSTYQAPNTESEVTKVISGKKSDEGINTVIETK